MAKLLLILMILLKITRSFPVLSKSHHATRLYNQRPVIQWYPGHIAKAEKLLQETMKAVDVVIEVRDARALKATSHPNVANWCGGKPRIVALTHGDTVPTVARSNWRQAYEQLGMEHPDLQIDSQIQNQAKQAEDFRMKYSGSTFQQVIFVNGKTGEGIHGLTRNIFKAGAHVQERRLSRGLKERPLRVGVIGYPNVGKSALINRILGRRRAKTANTPGVTRSLQWIRVKADDNKGKEFELLDSPGIIPANLVDQSDAILLAACNCIGEAAYDNQAVAAYLCEWLLEMHRQRHESAAPEWREQCIQRYKFDPLEDKVDGFGERRKRTGEDMLFDVADSSCLGNPEDASRKILQDFRSGRMGPICLQIAPKTKEDGGQTRILQEEEEDNKDDFMEKIVKEQQERAVMAKEKAEELGLELPEKTKPDAVGKGMFEGW